MEIKIRNYAQAQYLQEGGPVEAPVEDPNAAPADGEDPQAQLIAACQQALQSQDCELAMQVCNALLQMMGGGAPAAPEGAQPVYGKGGRLVKWVRK